MAEYEVLIRDSTRRALLDIFERLETRFPSAARRLMVDFQRTADSLCVAPERGRRIDGLDGEPTIRWMWVDRPPRHRLFYYIEGGRVILVDIEFRP